MHKRRNIKFTFMQSDMVNVDSKALLHACAAEHKINIVAASWLVVVRALVSGFGKGEWKVSWNGNLTLWQQLYGI